MGRCSYFVSVGNIRHFVSFRPSQRKSSTRVFYIYDKPKHYEREFS